MRQVLTSLCLVSIVWGSLPAAAGAVEAGSLKALDHEYGFRGVHFGDSVDALKGAKAIGERGACEKAYVRPSDRLEFDGVRLTGIEYSLQNGRLTVVSLLAAADSCVKLYQALTRAYGEDTSKQSAMVAAQKFWTATWTGERVRLDITGPISCTVTITAPEEAILEERQCREDDRLDAGKGP